jgi:hypothetical protein
VHHLALVAADGDPKRGARISDASGRMLRSLER